MLIRKHRDAAHTLERAIEREDLAKRDSETLLHRPLADIRDPRRAAENRQSKIDGRSQCMGATAAMGNWVRRRGWKMVMAMAKAACEAADRVAPTMGLWWRGGDGDNGGSSEREEVQRWPSRARTGRRENGRKSRTSERLKERKAEIERSTREQVERE